MKLLFSLFFMIISFGWASSQELALTTNFVDYANMGTLNIEASYGVAKNWSVNAGAKYNPFSYRKNGEEARSRQRTVSAGVRYWPWHIYSGWWLSGSARYQEYNHGGFSSLLTSEGDRFGLSVGGGYTYMLSPKLNLEFGVAFWTGYDVYTSYACPTCGKKLEEGGRFFFFPSDLLLGLSYIF